MSLRVPNGYVVDVETNERIEFFAWNPFSNQVSAQYQLDAVRGRSTPHAGYVNTDEDRWSISIFLSVDARATDPAVDGRTLQDKINFVKSFNYPDYGDANTARVVKSPHRCMILRGELKLVGYLSGYSATERAPYDVTGLPMLAEVSFQLSILPQTPRSMVDIRQWWTL